MNHISIQLLIFSFQIVYNFVITIYSIIDKSPQFKETWIGKQKVKSDNFINNKLLIFKDLKGEELNKSIDYALRITLGILFFLFLILEALNSKIPIFKSIIPYISLGILFIILSKAFNLAYKQLKNTIEFFLFISLLFIPYYYMLDDKDLHKQLITIIVNTEFKFLHKYDNLTVSLFWTKIVYCSLFAFALFMFLIHLLRIILTKTFQYLIHFSYTHFEFKNLNSIVYKLLNLLINIILIVFNIVISIYQI